MIRITTKSNIPEFEGNLVLFEDSGSDFFISFNTKDKTDQMQVNVWLVSKDYRNLDYIDYDAPIDMKLGAAESNYFDTDSDYIREVDSELLDKIKDNTDIKNYLHYIAYGEEQDEEVQGRALYVPIFDSEFYAGIIFCVNRNTEDTLELKTGFLSLNCGDIIPYEFDTYQL